MKLRPEVFIDATHHLWDGRGNYGFSCDEGRIFSCNAITMAGFRHGYSVEAERAFYHSLMPTAFEQYGFPLPRRMSKTKQQAIRFMFLYLAYLIAKDGGLDA